MMDPDRILDRRRQFERELLFGPSAGKGSNVEDRYKNPRWSGLQLQTERQGPWLWCFYKMEAQCEKEVVETIGEEHRLMPDGTIQRIPITRIVPGKLCDARYSVALQ